MITREDLENAAFAVGMLAVRMSDDGSGLCPYGMQDVWRPHTDIGDAARLAVKMRGVMAVSNDARGCLADNSEARYPHPPDINMYVGHDGTQADAERAYCEAITLCAAVEGKRMKEGSAK